MIIYQFKFSQIILSYLAAQFMNPISKRTRMEFQEFLVIYTLREIEVLFANHDLFPKHLPDNQLPPGQRRGRVEQYYANIDWDCYNDVRKVLDVFEEILDKLLDDINSDSQYILTIIEGLEKTFKRLVKSLERDGFKYMDGRIATGPLIKIKLDHDAIGILESRQFDEYVNRIKASIEDDPALAIGSTKELVEAVLKTILTSLENVDFDKDDDIPKLLRKVQKGLKLTPDSIDSAARGAEIIRILLSNLGSVVIKLAELRNLYGTGHGVEKKRNRLVATL